MPTEAAERRLVRAQQLGAPLPPVDQDPLPCPRCASTNTKFCYYNNYNFSQPRHFCKGCRRYWTHGGTLRDIPVGGGSRKTAKRSRTCNNNNNNNCGTPGGPTSPHSSSSPNNNTAFSCATATATSAVPPATLAVGPGGDPIAATPLYAVAATGGFTSLLSHAGPGLLTLGGFGFGLGLEDNGFGLGRGVWAFPEVGYGGYNLADAGGGVGVASNGSSGGSSGDAGGCVSGGRGGDTWRVESGGDHGGYGHVSADSCFPSLPELAISTTGNGRS